MSKTSLTRVFIECQGELLGFLQGRVKCAATARDLYQDIYLRLHRVEDPDGVQNARGYIFQIARNLVKDHIRNETKRSQLLEKHGLLDWEAGEISTPEDIVLLRGELTQLQRAIPELPNLSRRIFHAHRFEGKTRRDIAREYGVSLTTVENHIRRVLEHLSNSLDEIDSPN